MRAAAIVAVVVVVAGCKAEPKPPRCELAGDYRLGAKVGSDVVPMAFHVDDPMEPFRPARGRSAEDNRKLAEDWFVTQLKFELTEEVPGIGIATSDRIFVTPDLSRCKVKLEIFSDERSEQLTLTLAVPPGTFDVTGLLENRDGSLNAPVTGRLVTTPAAPAADQRDKP